MIEQLIGRRLAVRSGISDANDRELWAVFFPERVEEEPTSEYVTLRSLARPRHAITLCQEAINAAQRAGRSDVTRAWVEKRKKITESDNFFLNRRLLDESGDEWTERDIDRRGRWVGDTVIKLWSRE